MNVGILGSGFGLYGYLPSLLSIGSVRVVLPRGYAPRVLCRDDIRSLGPQIDWVDDERELLASCDALVVSRRPEDQASKLAEVLAHPRIRALAIEKPIAPTPVLASAMLDLLETAGLRFRIGFTFRHTPWARSLLAALRGRTSHIDALDLFWSFRAHHHVTGARNWKRSVSSGGGALRFYGIHLVALLAECGYDASSESRTTSCDIDEADTWQATLSGPGLPCCRVMVDCNATVTEFSLRSKAAEFPDFTLADPFDDVDRHPSYDRRVNVVARLCRDLLEGGETSCAWYRGATDLWASIEAVNVRHVSAPTSPAHRAYT